jgi:phage FluMu gp28-like protein
MLNTEPFPAQEEWLECRSTVKTACCGRGWGKSYSESIDLIWFAVTKPKTKQYLFAPTADQSRIIMRYVEQMLQASRIPDIVERAVQSPFPEITFANGSLIGARSIGDTGKNVRGLRADRVVLDEAAYIPGDIVNDVVSPMLIVSPHHERVNISTPFGLNHFHDDFQRGQRHTAGYASFRFPTSSNPYVTEAYLAQQRREMTDMAFAVEYLAEFMPDQNAVFRPSVIEACMDVHLETPAAPLPSHRYVLGYDPAKWVDRSGVVVLDVTAEPWRVVAVEDISGRDYIEHQLPAIKALATKYNNAAILLDSTHNDPLLEMLTKERLQVEGFQFTNASKQELINGLVIAMEQGRVSLPSHRDLLDELKHYRYELTAAGNVKLGAAAKHHDDLVTALALATLQAGKGRVFRHEDIQAAFTVDLEPDKDLFA